MKNDGTGYINKISMHKKSRHKKGRFSICQDSVTRHQTMNIHCYCMATLLTRLFFSSQPLSLQYVYMYAQYNINAILIANDYLLINNYVMVTFCHSVYLPAMHSMASGSPLLSLDPSLSRLCTCRSRLPLANIFKYTYKIQTVTLAANNRGPDKSPSGHFSVREICTGGQFSVCSFAWPDNSPLMSLHTRTNLHSYFIMGTVYTFLK